MPAADRSSQIAILSSATADSLVYGLRSLNCDVQVVDLAGLHRLEASLCALVVIDGTSLEPVPTIRSVRGVPGLGETPILLCGASGPRLYRNAVTAGASDVVAEGGDSLELLTRARNLVELWLARCDAEISSSMLRVRLAAIGAAAREREREIIHRLMLAAESRDDQAGDHLTRVAGFSIANAEGLGLSEKEANELALASTMHDLGKIGVPDSVLLKAGPLTPEERLEIQEHTTRGHRMLHGSSSHLLQLAAQIALSHHERWDGGGYPGGLAGEAIPLPGRIVAVADVFDALVSERPYKRAWPLEKAREHLIAQKGSHFDPACVDAFLSRWDDVVVLLEDRPTTSCAA